MKVLIACEFSGIVREAFAKRGHDAWSCDLLPTEQLGNHIQGDVLDILNDGWDLMIAHPPCFSGDTLVLTENGYKEISKILIGERVLTHLGRWKTVTGLQSRYVNETLTVKITGSAPIVTTKEHPFLIRKKTKSWIPETKRYFYKNLSDSYWEKAANLVRGDLVGMVLPPTEKSDISDEILWLMGLYVAEGDLRFRNNKFEQVRFSIGSHELDRFKSKINRKHTDYANGSTTRVVMYGKDFCQSFAQFGRSCYTKRLPKWVLSLPKDQAKIFLDGYLSGDGHLVKGSNVITASTVSKELASGIKILMRRVYEKPVGTTLSDRSDKQTTIEGRLVNQSPCWVVRCSFDSSKQRSEIDNNYTWNPVKESSVTGANIVYNLSVEDDESYIVDQCIVHNCTYLTNAGVRHLHENVASKNGVKAKIHGAARMIEMEKAAEFFNKLLNAPIPKICVENPIPHKYARAIIGNYTQLIQPWQFGHGETKATCLWLRNLPQLVPTNIVSGREARIHKMGPSADRWKKRSVTYAGIAEAFANQWG